MNRWLFPVLAMVPMAPAVCGTLSGRMPAAAPGAAGVVARYEVEWVTPEGAAVRAGLGPGDVLRVEDTEPAGVWRAMEIARRGLFGETVSLQRDGGEPVTIPQGPWETAWLPADPSLPSALREAFGYKTLEDWQAAQDAFLRAAEDARRVPELASFCLFQAGRCAEERRDYPAAADLHGRALAAGVPSPRGAWFILRARAWCLHQTGHTGDALADLQAFLGERAGEGPLDMEQAIFLADSAYYLETLGQADAADARWTRALAAVARDMPASFAYAELLRDRAFQLRARGGQALEAAQLFESALHRFAQVAPWRIEGPAVAGSAGGAWFTLGRLGRAEAALNLGAEIVAPQFVGALVPLLNNLALVRSERGDNLGAERAFLEALEKGRDAGLPPARLGQIENNLGVNCEERGDLDGAETWYRRALVHKQEGGASDIEQAVLVSNLGQVEERRGHPGEARAAYENALALLAPHRDETAFWAVARNNLANMDLQDGALDDAEAGFTEAEAWHLAHTPGTRDHAIVLLNRARLARRRHLPQDAEALLHQALSMAEDNFPGHPRRADMLFELADLLHDTGRGAEAERALEDSLSVLDEALTNTGGGDLGRAAFAAGMQRQYATLIRWQLDGGRADAAFATLERSRGAAFLRLLAERTLEFGDPDFAALEAHRRALQRDMDTLLAELEQAPAAERDGIRARVASNREEQHGLRDLALRQSPRYAALRFPESMDAGEAARLLAPGEMFVTWADTGDHLWVLWLAAGGKVQARKLDSDAAGTARLVRRLRAALEADDPALPGLLTDAGVRLLGPAWSALRGARRVLVAPDGPLWLLPVAALDPSGGRVWRPLAERVPVCEVLSMTVYRELRRRANGKGAGLEVFADPAFAPDSGWDALPGTRREAQSLAQLDPAARLHLGAEATERAFRTNAVHAEVLHVATHAQVEERFPLESTLAFTPWPAAAGAAPSEDDGRLQAFEILENVRTDADLVVLSACETGLGENLTGEGMLGLSRAFFHAGARTLLLTLWPVDDEATASLMTAFHAQRMAGMPADQALAAAQRAARAQHLPARDWSAFVLLGAP